MAETARFLPWQEATAVEWLGGGDRFAHAWLIHGLSGIGKRSFALAAAASLLCEQPQQGLACGNCQACRWVSSGNHPDFRRVRPDAVAVEEGDTDDEAESQTKKTPSREIRVEQIRALSGWFSTATHRGGWRVAVVYPAQAMNVITANALLKVLEEPPPRTVFLLTTDAPDLLLPTIVSRCRRLPLPVPDVASSTAWLKEQGLAEPEGWLAAAGGAPLRALQLSRLGDTPCPAWLQGYLRALAAASGGTDPVAATADALERMEPAVWIDALQRAFVDLSLVAAGAAPRYFPSQADVMSRIAEGASPALLAAGVKWLAAQRAVAGHPLSAKLFVHSVLQRCAQACASTGAAQSA
ncbi:MAG TPA: DNA polymerase III subunit delta' [Burkholderiaceae bacterium]|nr:DNA polymerase III subunit delta' [Burkholderiaceae bacterium]